MTTPISGYHIPHMVRAADGMFYVAFTKEPGPGAGGPARLYKFDGNNWTLLKDPNSGDGRASASAACPSPAPARPPASRWA